MKPVLLPLAERIGRMALRRNGVKTRWVDTPHARVHAYVAEGSGTLPTTVLLHGLGSAATPFGPLLGRMRKHVRRIVAPDYPGHGFSENAARLTPEALFGSVTHALDVLVDEPALVVGNSLGGAVALNYTISNPGKVRALVLVSPAGAHSTAQEWETLRSTFSLKTSADARAFIQRLYHRPPWFLHLLAHEFPEVVGRRAVRELIDSASNDHLPSPDVLRSLTIPILFIWGESERLLPDSHLDYFQKHLPPHAEIERPAGFGHCPHFDDPAALAARIADFARTHLR